LREYEQVKECTFEPQINRAVSMPTEQVEIRGLERHLELRELQRRKEEQQMLREAEVFGLNAEWAFAG